MKKTLEMTFRNESGKESVLTMPDPKDDLTLIGVKAVMQNIVDKKIFATKSGLLTQVLEAKVRVVDIAILQ